MIWFVVFLSCIGQICAETPLNYGVHNDRVIGGNDAAPGVWTWQVSLQQNFYDDGYFYHICGGSLIDAYHIMTAAHCIDSGPEKYRVVAGDYNVFEYEGNEQFRRVKSIHIHPYWNGDLSRGNDIAVMTLSEPVFGNSFVSIGNVPHNDDALYNGFPCYITGWGVMDDHASVPAILQEAMLPVVEHSVCSRPDWWGSNALKTMVCAGGDGVVSGCQGDSGGPLNCFSHGSWWIHGVVSYGPAGSCNQATKPTVFTRVSAFRDWIFSVSLLSPSKYDSVLHGTLASGLKCPQPHAPSRLG
ncbi:chymotrypsin-like elastase family member 1 [Antennarius striatus]|uniref:chymotrypsin-like elastase family member 1 n=1 Tax=Antennarius striatus TaxID=241820 RepID=UPI0035B44691